MTETVIPVGIQKNPKLNQMLVEARKYGHEASAINGLVKSSCLIIDEVSRYIFDKESTRMFFDVIVRRYSMQEPNNMIFTNNKGADKWNEFFSKDSSLLCALDRIFDDATVYIIKGNSYRDRKRETYPSPPDHLRHCRKTTTKEHLMHWLFPLIPDYCFCWSLNG